MTTRALRRPTFVAALVAAASLTLTACFGGGAPPPTEPGGGSSAPPAAVACASIDGDDAPLVIVENESAGPEITTVPAAATPEEESAAIAEANRDGDVVSIERDVPVEADAQANDQHRPLQWALNNVPFEDAWTSPVGGTTGTGQVVAVVDSGVRANHQDLSGQVLPGHFYLHSEDGGTAFSGAGGTTDGNGHGTHVAGTIGAVANNGIGIAGAAPGVEILPVQVLCNDGNGWSSDVASGIIWAVDHGADVINLSLGGDFTTAGQSAVQYARAQGVVVVAAAGNNKQKGNSPSYPAALPEVIAVGATTNANTRASYSNTGAYLDLVAPGGSGSGSGTAVLSTYNSSTSAYASMAGTSMASPHVAAAAALVRAAHAEYGPIDVCTQLIRTATDLGPAGVDDEYGYGLINPFLAVGLTVPGLATCT